MKSPILVALDLGAESNEVVTSAVALARSLDAPLVPMHVLGWLPLESDGALEARIEVARAGVQALFAPALDEGVGVLEPIVRRGRPDEEVLRSAAGVGAQIIVTGGAGAANVWRWVMGSVAERIIRGATVPVYVARAEPPRADLPILCPIDLSPHSRAGLHAAIRMARAYASPLITLTVIPELTGGWLSAADLEHALSREEEVAARQVRDFIGATDMADLVVEHRVVVGDPAKRIVEASEDAWLMVMASRGFSQLRATALGGVTERSIRMSRCSLFTVRDEKDAPDQHEQGLHVLATLVGDADERMAGGSPARALALLELASVRAPANAMIQEKMADALDALGRDHEAEARRKLADVIRRSFA